MFVEIIGKTKTTVRVPVGQSSKKCRFKHPNTWVGFAVTVLAPPSKSSGSSVSRKVPLDIDFANNKLGKGAFARTCSLVYSQLKYWWKYAKWNYNNKMWFYKSQKELSDELGMSEKTIWRALKRLKELGLILVEKHHQQYWKQVHFYHLCYFPAPTSRDGVSSPVSNPSSYKSVSTQKERPARPSKNDGIQHKKTNPLQEIIRRANQHRTTGIGFGGETNTMQDKKTHYCSVCRNSGLVENDRNIAIRCECASGRQYQHLLPLIGEVNLLPQAA